MSYKMSPNIAVITTKYAAAVKFYTQVLGFPDRSDKPDLADLDANPLNLFIIQDDEINGPVMELFVDDLRTARDELLANGCEILHWRGMGQDCYI